jgi:alanyl-tRNA synthetase
MKKRSAENIRTEFLDFFKEHGHKIRSSSPLVPQNDPSLLFTNAGMVPFKDVFTGQQTRPFPTAASSQKCVRAGGKHNDLENVGYTARHNTFFEMLGNFSFGDYFKKKAIHLAWDFLVNRLQLDPDRLWVSVFKGDPENGLPADEESAQIWQAEIGVDQNRILRFGKKDNFWSMGNTGPCGPCSEIHYDQGDRIACPRKGKCQKVACECDRYLEIWNLVFMQYNRTKQGELQPLPTPSIDTGMGLERLAAVLQSASSNYDTDLFLPLLHCMAKIAKRPYGQDKNSDISLKVVADHARATAFLMADGVQPANEGRGYVLRRIMRRAIRHGSKLGVNQLFFHKVCLEVVLRMQHAYPELTKNAKMIEQATKLEEKTFRRTLDRGLHLLTKEI